MAHHREVSIAVCGIVVGTMLGAGSLILGRDVTASVGDEDAQFTTYRQGIIFDNQYRKRAISEEDRRTRPRAEVQQFNESEAAPDVGQGTVVDTEECRQRVRYAEISSCVLPCRMHSTTTLQIVCRMLRRRHRNPKRTQISKCSRMFCSTVMMSTVTSTPVHAAAAASLNSARMQPAIRITGRTSL